MSSTVKLEMNDDKGHYPHGKSTCRIPARLLSDGRPQTRAADAGVTIAMKALSLSGRQWLIASIMMCLLLSPQVALSRTSSVRANQPVLKKFILGKVVIEATLRGSGDTIVLIPGRGLDADSLSNLAGDLNRVGLRTVVINARGIGGSSGPLDGLTLHDFAADVAGVIEALGLRQVHVLGHAYGNRVARCLAVDRPDLVKTVILLAAGGRVGPLAEIEEAAQKLDSGKLSRKETLEELRAVYFSPSSDSSPWLHLKPWKATSTSQMAAIMATPLEEWWSGGQSPMLVIQGLDDKVAPPGNGRALRDEFGKRVTLVELPKAGHALIVERPKTIAAIINRYLKLQRNHH